MTLQIGGSGGDPLADYVKRTELTAGLAGKAASAHTHGAADIPAPVDTVARAALFGAAGNLSVPTCEYELTTGYSGLAAGDYWIAGNMSAVTDEFSMLSTAWSFLRVVLPYAGRWNVEWQAVTSAKTGYNALKVALNVPRNTGPNPGTTGYSIMTGIGSPGGEGTPAAINRSRRFAAGDELSFLIYTSVTADMPVTTFGGIRTRFAVRWAGPK